MSLPEDVKIRLEKHFSDFSKGSCAIFGVSDDLNVYTSKLCNLLGVEPFSRSVCSFKCGESYVCLNSSARGKNAYLIIPVLPDVNSRLIETFFFIDALKSAEVKEINLIFPCLPYARQDRRNDKREHIGTRVLATCVDALKGSTKLRVITLDMHSSQTEAAYRDTDIEPLRLNSLYSYVIRKFVGTEKLTLMSPDFGGVKRLEKFHVEGCSSRVAFVHKKRSAHNVSEVCEIVGDIEGRNVIMIDDMFDTGGSMINACRAAKELGALKVDVLVTHAYFSGDAISKLASAQKAGYIDKFIFTDTIRLDDSKYEEMKRLGVRAYVIPTTIFIADVIYRLQNGLSLSPLYSHPDYIEELYSDVGLRKIE
ncbi:ribose-phosphate pyrophosphokinase [Candidatus Woesearchaeota archaeon]|nr:ribose-phosphate pyrophosphokinase [Candidatus Woesearchaeota archaeon]